MTEHSPLVKFYFERFGFGPPLIAAEPARPLGMVVVIPCIDEPGLIDALDALANCEPPALGVEVIVVVNSAADAPDAALAQNARSLRDAGAWAVCRPEFRLHLLDCPGLPPKKAGVGLARKIGMDEALRRLDRAGRLDGVIVCFDADCTCDPNYLVEIDRFFRDRPRAPGCSIYFEHPLEGAEEGRIYEGIVLYELHLRYYVEALRQAGFPHAFHTIGSSMAVRAKVYCQQGGMNKRQAGEDFYFLHKIIPLGEFAEINTTRVIASPRPSERVPFGTGRAVREYLDRDLFESYPIAAFHDMRALFDQVPSLYSAPLGPVAKPLSDFLHAQNFDTHLEQIRRNTASAATFRRRFFRWFDGFLAMKYVHFARDTVYGSSDVVEVSRELYGALRQKEAAPAAAAPLLLAFRQMQRERHSA